MGKVQTVYKKFAKDRASIEIGELVIFAKEGKRTVFNKSQIDENRISQAEARLNFALLPVTSSIKELTSEDKLFVGGIAGLKGRDNDRDILFEEADLINFSREFLATAPIIDWEHSLSSVGKICESMLLPSPEFGGATTYSVYGNNIDPGSWMLGAFIDNDTVIDEYQAGRVKGFSMSFALRPSKIAELADATIEEYMDFLEEDGITFKDWTVVSVSVVEDPSFDRAEILAAFSKSNSTKGAKDETNPIEEDDMTVKPEDVTTVDETEETTEETEESTEETEESTEEQTEETEGGDDSSNPSFSSEDVDNKVKEAVKAAEARFSKKLEEQSNKHQKETKELSEKLSSLENENAQTRSAYVSFQKTDGKEVETSSVPSFHDLENRS